MMNEAKVDPDAELVEVRYRRCDEDTQTRQHLIEAEKSDGSYVWVYAEKFAYSRVDDRHRAYVFRKKVVSDDLVEVLYPGRAEVVAIGMAVPDEEIVDLLENLLEKAHSGELRALTVVGEMRDGQMYENRAGNYNAIATLGLLARMMHTTQRDIDASLVEEAKK